MKISLQKKRAVVTAGGPGMGRSAALAMHALGAKVYTCDIDAEALRSLSEQITSYSWL